MIDSFASTQFEDKDVRLTDVIYSLPQRRLEFPLSKSVRCIISTKSEASLPSRIILLFKMEKTNQ